MVLVIELRPNIDKTLFLSKQLVKNMSTTLLALESSCDDTSAAIIQDGAILSNIMASQTVHQKYGGVVPEVASRAHQANIIPVVQEALKVAKTDLRELDGIAFTRGPGLMGSLIVGVSFAKSLALSLNLPLIEVNHMMAHVLAHFAEDPKPQFPFLCLTVSGGHTQILIVHSPFKMEVIGSTLDDAAGEAFDKTGKLLGLNYPAGPLIDQLAKQGKVRFPFPEPRIKDLDFSFSGLKTSILYFLKKEIKNNPDFIKENLADLCASIQDRIVSILMNKLIKASEKTGIQEIAVAGGVSANSLLRSELQNTGDQKGWKTYIPAFQYCTDNAAMIAVAAFFKFQHQEFSSQEVTPDPRLPILLPG